MAKGSVRKKGKKWYYRFYVEDASGNLVQKEYAGTESKSETEKLLRQAMDDYECYTYLNHTSAAYKLPPAKGTYHLCTRLRRVCRNNPPWRSL